jgi:hypothetical protein
MIEIPELGERIEVTIVGVFGLGLLAKKEDGGEAQLRAPEMKEELLAPFRDRSFPPNTTEFDELIGLILWVYEFLKYPARVSQYSQLELNLKSKQDSPVIEAWVKKLNELR